MAIYNKNQATVSQNHTKDCRLSNKDDDMLSLELGRSILRTVE